MMVHSAAARWPLLSEPANNNFNLNHPPFIRRMLTRSWKSTTRGTPLLGRKVRVSKRGAKSNWPICAGKGTGRYRHLHSGLNVRSCPVACAKMAVGAQCANLTALLELRQVLIGG
jgi:hypothetical protein